MQGYSIPETTRAYGAVLLNADREEFTDSLGRATRSRTRSSRRSRPGAACSPRTGARRSGSTRRGSRPPTPRCRSRTCSAATAAAGSTRSPSRSSYPVLHYQNGGLVIDTDAETLAGVFACGEIAGGTHGRNRMMGNSLLECVVFGRRRAGTAAATKARGMTTDHDDRSPRPSRTQPRTSTSGRSRTSRRTCATRSPRRATARPP